MRALIVCDNHERFSPALTARIPLCMLPVGGKPLVAHLIEALGSSGVTRVTLAVANQAGFVQAMLRDGSRFGAKLDYLPVRPRQETGRILRLLSPSAGEDLLLASGLLLADAGPEDVLALRGGAGSSMTLGWPPLRDGAPAPELTLLGVDDLARLAAGNDSPDELLARLCAARVPGPGQALLVRDLDSWWEANVRFLERRPPFSNDASSRRGPHCRIHPRAVIEEPVCLGKNVEIGAGCRIGPLTIIGDNCIVDDGVEITNSALLPGTFAGLNTTLDRSLACQDLLVRLDDGSCLHVPDPFLLGPASALSLSSLLSDLTQRALAALLLALGLPALVAMALLGLARPDLWRKRTVAVDWDLATLDGQRAPRLETLRFFDSSRPLLARLPALWDVMRGAVNLVGVEPLPPDQVRNLFGAFAEAHYCCRAGLLHPWDAQDGPEPDFLERRVMETYYAQTRTLAGDLRLALGALARLARPRERAQIS